MNLKLSAILAVALLSVILHESQCGRRGGGGSRSSSSGGLFGSRKKSSSSGTSWWGGSKKKTPSQSNPANSYPKQQYTNTGGTGGSAGGSVGNKNNIGGGGWSNTNTNNRGSGSNANLGYGKQSQNSIGGGGWNNRGGSNNRGNIYSGGNNYNSYSSGYGRSNYGYYGGGGFNNHYSNGGLFGGGSRSFGLGAGAGFLGGAVAGVAAMSMYHRYRMYQSMSMYQMGGMGYGGYGYGNQYGSGYGHRRRGMLLDEFDCIGGCPMQAFCDYGVCRCRNGYDARYGSCWKRYEDFEKQNWDERKQPAYVPYKSCSDHQQCRQTDMNMVCKQDTQTCQCRDTMKWNDEALECQVFMDVNCTDVSTVESPVVEVNTTTVIKQPTAVNEEEFKFDDSFIYTNTTEGAEGLNITSVTADETLATSELASLDINKTSSEDIRHAFCRDIARVARSYEQKADVRRRPIDNGGRSTGIGIGTTALIIIFICTFCCCFLGYKFKNKIQESMQNKERTNYQMTDDQQIPHGGSNVYPPPAQDYVGYQAQPAQVDMPPLGPAIPPTQPGYPAIPDPAYGGPPLYPQVGDSGPPAYPAAPGYPPAPYPPAPGDVGGPPPYDPSNQATPYPIYPPQGNATPYPPQQVNPTPYPPAQQGTPYPPQPAYNPAA
jgi:hypothetical protein